MVNILPSLPKMVPPSPNTTSVKPEGSADETTSFADQLQQAASSGQNASGEAKDMGTGVIKLQQQTAKESDNVSSASVEPRGRASALKSTHAKTTAPTNEDSENSATGAQVMAVLVAALPQPLATQAVVQPITPQNDAKEEQITDLEARNASAINSALQPTPSASQNAVLEALLEHSAGTSTELGAENLKTSNSQQGVASVLLQQATANASSTITGTLVTATSPMSFPAVSAPMTSGLNNAITPQNNVAQPSNAAQTQMVVSAAVTDTLSAATITPVVLTGETDGVPLQQVERLLGNAPSGLENVQTTLGESGAATQPSLAATSNAASANVPANDTIEKASVLKSATTEPVNLSQLQAQIIVHSQPTSLPDRVQGNSAVRSTIGPEGLLRSSVLGQSEKENGAKANEQKSIGSTVLGDAAKTENVNPLTASTLLPSQSALTVEAATKASVSQESTIHAPGVSSVPEATSSTRTSEQGANGNDLANNNGAQSQQSNAAVPIATSTQTTPSTGVTSSTTGQPQSLFDRVQVAQQVVQHLEAARAMVGQGEISLRLSPPELGTLRISLSSSAQGVTAHLVAETSQVQSALMSERHRLHAALEAQGLKVHSLEISTGSTGQQSLSAFSNSQQMPWQTHARSQSTYLTTREGGLTSVVPVEEMSDGRVLDLPSLTSTSSSRLNFLA